MKKYCEKAIDFCMPILAMAGAILVIALLASPAVLIAISKGCDTDSVIAIGLASGYIAFQLLCNCAIIWMHATEASKREIPFFQVWEEEWDDKENWHMWLVNSYYFVPALIAFFSKRAYKEKEVN